MRPLSQGELLEVWECGLEQSSLDRTLAMLRLAGSEKPEQFTVGESDWHLLKLRELMFGPEITALAHCPQCNCAVEVNFNVADISIGRSTSDQGLVLSEGGYEACFRLVTLADLRTLQGATLERLQQSLLERCLLNLKREGQTVAAEELPESFIRMLSERMAQADPQAEIGLQLECFGCHHQWNGDFDVESFFWAEIQAWAGRMLNEIHQLAAAYGWGEQQILALSPLRRHVYLNLATN
jgi:hypothetical protein